MKIPNTVHEERDEGRRDQAAGPANHRPVNSVRRMTDGGAFPNPEGRFRLLLSVIFFSQQD